MRAGKDGKALDCKPVAGKAFACIVCQGCLPPNMPSSVACMPHTQAFFLALLASLECTALYVIQV